VPNYRSITIMGLADIAHKSIVAGLLGVTVYYSIFIAGTSATIVEKHRANRAAQRNQDPTQDEPSS
jgi:hypothetical protein